MAARQQTAPLSSRVEVTHSRFEAGTSVEKIRTWQQSLAHFIGTIDTLMVGLAIYAISQDRISIAWGALTVIAGSLVALVLLAIRENRKTLS